MRAPRGLSPDEAAMWARVAATVKPLNPRKVVQIEPAPLPKAAPPPPAKRSKPAPPVAAPTKPAQPAAKPRPLDRHGLDGTWDRKLATAAIAPDFTLDLHGCNLDAAHGRLEHGLHLAASQGARVVLVVTGRPRPVEAADRGERRGAIRAKLLDWLAAGRHAGQIAAVRPAHPRHGGAGAVYVVLKRAR
ncbi:MAG: Smr/MutS family protein [Novosphingobium sp.]